MRLKSLELVGFKSFFDPTKISFAPGITAIVGPNGCGKSNLVDAIRWVLGEQSASRLRAKTVDDLIFAGSERRAPAGMAQVSLVLETDPSVAPFPSPFQSHSEVAVVRRLYRSGESEYQINKIPCRLRDVSEFFMALGIHSRTYAIIPQGKVEEIIQAKPRELRAVIEEAAGLSLFKERRDLSERKLARVRENLTQIEHVLSEVERQLASARRQAKRAQTYKALTHERDELERICLSRRVVANEAELRQFEAEQVRIAQQLEQARAEHSALANAAQELNEKLSNIEQQLQARSQELETLAASASERERTRKFVMRRLAEIEQLEPRLAGQLQELAQKLDRVYATCAELENELQHAPAEDDARMPEVAALNEQFDRARNELKGIEEQSELLKDEVAELMRQAAVVRMEIAQMQRQREALGRRLGAVESELETIRRSVSEAEDARLAAHDEVARIRAELASAETELEAASERERRALEALRTTEAAVARAREQIDAAVRRIRRLELDVAQQRLQTVIEALDGNRPPGQLRFVADVIKAPVALEAALAAALGELLGAVIVDSPDFVLCAVEILKQKGGGRLSFVPEDLQASLDSSAALPSTHSDRLIDHLYIEQGYWALAQALLGNVRLAQDVQQALAAAANGGSEQIYVTPHGDIVRPGRILSGGSRLVPEEPDGLDCPLSMTQAQQLLEEAQREKEGAARSFDGARKAREEVEGRLKAIRTALARAEATLASSETRRNRIEQEYVLTNARRAELVRQLAEIEEKLPLLEKRLEELASLEQSKREELGRLKTPLQEKKDAVEELAIKLKTIVAERESAQQKRKALEAQLRQARLLATAIEEQITEHRQRLDTIHKEREELEAEALRLQREHETGFSRERELERQVEELRQQREVLAQEVGIISRRLTDSEALIRRFEQQKMELELKRERTSALTDELKRAFAERFKVSFDDSRQELTQSLEGREPEADARRLNELQAQLERLGAVNLEAEEDAAQLSARAETLRSERDDLVKAADDLRKTIEKLNREAARRFETTFDAVASNFAQIVPKLLDGGKGRLELARGVDEQEDDGLQVLVQPPGKRVKELSLLSGGEKALSALALILSLFLINPSPFCLLDEVDAPLDERSLQAFTGLLGDLKDKSQFVLVTHNQTTMREADQIYGVTMAEPGVSQVLSVRLAETAA